MDLNIYFNILSNLKDVRIVHKTSICLLWRLSESHSVVSNSATPRYSPGWNTGVGSCSLLQGIFPTQGSNPRTPALQRILYQLSCQGSPRILEWVACLFSRGSSWPRGWTWASCIAGGFFTSWDTRESFKRYKNSTYNFHLCFTQITISLIFYILPHLLCCFSMCEPPWACSCSLLLFLSLSCFPYGTVD